MREIVKQWETGNHTLPSMINVFELVEPTSVKYGTVVSYYYNNIMFNKILFWY